MPNLASALVLDCDVSEVRLLLERYAGVLLDQSSDFLRENIAAYAASVHTSTGTELIAALRSSPADCDGLLEVLLADQSAFFGHPELFETLEKRVLSQLEQRKSADNPRSLRILSAGCSTGEEAYSIAISVCEALSGSCAGWNIHIIGSDIRRGALATAERGLYTEAALKSIPRHWLMTYLARVGDHFLVKPRVRNLLTFTPMNLAQANFIGRFDCIFCVDVLSHFSAGQRSALLQRLHMFLEPGGYLFVGEGEKVGSESGFETEAYLNCTYYQRPMATAARTGR
jgi:chemotaxis methyl-accepting protein methylase